MLATLREIIRDHIEWGGQISRLALFELKKKARGAVLGWSWFFIKPAMYVFCFWFAIDVGLRSGGAPASAGHGAYLMWLSAGIIPWFFMQDMLGAGVDVLHRYPYLVNKIKFPISGISTIYTFATMIVQLMLQGALFVMYAIVGMQFDVYLLQVPILLVLMFLFWDVFSIMLSQLSAMSKDVKNLMNAFSTPFFWLSGVIFDPSVINSDFIQVLFLYNPITFFTMGFRDAFYDKTWFWEDPARCFAFAAVFVVTLVVALFVYKRFHEEVADVL